MKHELLVTLFILHHTIKALDESVLQEVQKLDLYDALPSASQLGITINDAIREIVAAAQDIKRIINLLEEAKQ